MNFRSPFVLLPLAALLIGFAFSSQRRAGDDPLRLEPLGLPPRVEFTALLVHESDPRRLYVGTDDGVFVTRDGGSDWRQSGLDGIEVDRLAQRGGAVFAASGARTWRLAQGTWKRARAAPPERPEAERRLETGASLRLSTDGGKTWRVVLEASGGVPAAAWSPSEPGVAYAVGGDAQLYRSEDGGVTWLVAG